MERIIGILSWGRVFYEFVLIREIRVEESEYIYLDRDMDLNSSIIACEHYDTKLINISFVPESILNNVRNRLLDPFFDIELERFKRKIGWDDK
jgi:hypothetical protein